jgi:hypothetical protein
MASGTLTELTGRERGGADLVVTDLRPDVAERLGRRVRRITRIAEGRYHFELPPQVRPEPLIAELAATGAALVSLSPARTTLEDVFVEALGRAPARLEPEQKQEAS